MASNKEKRKNKFCAIWARILLVLKYNGKRFELAEWKSQEKVQKTFLHLSDKTCIRTFYIGKACSEKREVIMGNNNTQDVMQQYNETLLPVAPEKRTIKPTGLAIIWFGIVVQLTGFAVFSAMPGYFTIKQLLLIYLIGSAITALAAIAMQDIGLKHGLCFAKSAVAAFGNLGAKLPSFIRAFPSVIFFGTNAYVSSQALNEIFKMVFGFDNITVALALNIILLVLLTMKGLKGIERFTSFVAPLLLVIGIYLAFLLYNHYQVPLGELMNMGGANAGAKGWLYGISVAIGIFIMCSMGNNDYTRDCVIDPKETKFGKMNNKYTVATLIGIVPFLTFFCILGNCAVVLSGGRTDVIVVFSELLAEQSVVLAVIVDLFIVVAQFSTNTAANLIPSAYVACDFIPKMKYKVGILLVAVLAVICQPWSYYDYFDFVMNLFTVFTGPAMAIMLIDYFVFRKREYDVPELYKAKGKYYYWKGVNWVAVAVYIAAGLIGYFVDFDNSFFIATPIAAIAYLFIAKAFEKKMPVIAKE